MFSNIRICYVFFTIWLLVACPPLFCLPDAEAKKVRVGVKPGLQFDPKALHVRPGDEVELTFDNVDEMMHNFVLVQPDSRMEVVEAAIALGAEGPALHYVPKSEKVLAWTQVVLPGQKSVVRFKAPLKEGQYPYVCTFPGHGFVMHGILHVFEKVPKEMNLDGKELMEDSSEWGNFSNQVGAIVHRTFMPDSSPAAIAVNLPGGHSYCWDAGACRLRYGWRGGFIQKNGSFGRWRTLPTIEGLVYFMEDRFPFREKDRALPHVQFEGYRIIDGLPEFRYRAGNLKVSEYLAKLPGKSGLIRRFNIEGAANGIVWEIDPYSGVSYSFDKGKFSGSEWRLTEEEARSFQIHMQELPGKFPFLRLGMNDLAACYNRKGDLHPGALGQSWLMRGGKAVVPAQQEVDFSNGAALSFWLKLSDPSRPVSNIVFWEKGGGISYRSHEDPFVFGSAVEPFDIYLEGVFEAEEAKIKGPSRASANGGFLSSGYVDFGSKKGEFVEWEVTIAKDGPYTLRFRYASSDDRPLRLSVDGEDDVLTPSLPFSSTGSWTSWHNQDHKLDLKKGKRRIRLTSIVNRGPNVDRMEVLELKKTGNVRGVPLASKPKIDDQWHLVCLSFDGKKARLYLDGHLSWEEMSDATLSGKVCLDGGSGHPKYYLDELRVYDRPLSENEIKRLLDDRQEFEK